MLLPSGEAAAPPILPIAQRASGVMRSPVVIRLMSVVFPIIVWAVVSMLLQLMMAAIAKDKDLFM